MIHILLRVKQANLRALAWEALKIFFMTVINPFPGAVVEVR